MSKKRAEIRRAARAENEPYIYHFTAKSMRDHDEKQARAALEQRKKELQKEADEQVKKALECYLDNVGEADIANILCYGLSVSIRVLVEKFRWNPARGDDRRYNLAKFAVYAVEEIDRIKETTTLKDYSAETEKLYGISFESEEE